MQKPLQVPERWIKWILRMVVGGFIALVLTFVIVFGRLYFREHAAKVANLELHAAVIEIVQPDHHDTKWYVARMSDGKRIVLEDAMLGILRAGDSLFKKAGEEYYIMKQKTFWTSLQKSITGKRASRNRNLRNTVGKPGLRNTKLNSTDNGSLKRPPLPGACRKP